MILNSPRPALQWSPVTGKHFRGRASVQDNLKMHAKVRTCCSLQTVYTLALCSVKQHGLQVPGRRSSCQMLLTVA